MMTDKELRRLHREDLLQILIAQQKQIEDLSAALEDSVNGVKSAYAAGMITVMVPDLLPPTDEIKPMITHLCGDLSEAAALLCR